MLELRREGGGSHDGGQATSLDEASVKDRFRRIRCPQCAWQPSKDDLWQCSCRYCWNTFETRGVCPACGVTWRETQCLRCQRWSPHVEWYEGEQPSN